MEITWTSARPSTLQRPPEPSLDERSLVARAKAGDLDAYDRLFRAYYPRIYATAFHLVGNHEDAEDLAQDGFVRAHASLEWHRSEGSFLPWLRRIVVHLARDRFRAAGRRPSSAPLPLEVPARPQHGPQAELTRQEFGRILADAVAELPEHLRIALVLRTMDGLEYAEIAEATGVTPATARTQVMKGRRALHRRLSKYLDGGPA